MRRGLVALALLTPACLCSATSQALPTPSPYAADEPLDPEPPVRNGFSAKVMAGPSYRNLSGHDVWGARLAAAFGAQFKEIGAVHGEFGYGIGRTDGGLKTETFTFTPTWEFMFDRLRLGLGPQLTMVWVERVTNDDSMVAQGWGFATFVGVDLVQGDHANLHLVLDGRYSWTGDDIGFGGLGLSLGGRFKTP